MGLVGHDHYFNPAMPIFYEYLFPKKEILKKKRNSEKKRNFEKKEILKKIEILKNPKVSF